MKEMKKLTEKEKIEFIEKSKAKNNKALKIDALCTCGKGRSGSHWCEKCEVFTGGFRTT